jgi:hypothetical protein
MDPSTCRLAEDDHRFDLLVDGELSAAERRQLLAGLDEEPGGWRRCALAFLEAQAWQQDLGAIRREPRPPAADVSPRQRPRRRAQPGSLAAIAASFLIALFLGLLLREAWSVWSPDSSRIAGGRPAERAPSADDVPDATPGPPEELPGPVRLVRLEGPQGPDGRSQSILYPAVEQETLGEEWLEKSFVGLPEELQALFRRNGVRLHERRRLVPVRLRDGRRLVLPVSEVELHYTGGPTY